MSEVRMETKCVQSGYTPQNGEPRQIPIIQSTTFKYETSAAMGKLFDLEESGYFYTRLQNPTNDYVAAKIADRAGCKFLCCFQHCNLRRSCCVQFHHLRRDIQSVQRYNEEDGCRIHFCQP